MHYSALLHAEEAPAEILGLTYVYSVFTSYK